MEASGSDSWTIVTSKKDKRRGREPGSSDVRGQPAAEVHRAAMSASSKPESLRERKNPREGQERKVLYPEMCTYFGGCSKGAKCPYAHTEDEMASCIKELNREYDMKSIRDPPKNCDTIHVYKLCSDHRETCKWGKNCEFAHSKEELDQWEKKRKAIQSKKSRIRPLFVQSKPELCPNIGDSNCKCERAHSNEEMTVWSEALEKKILGSPVSVKYSNPSKSYSYRIDPFTVGTLDFQRRFGDIMSMILKLPVKAVFKDTKYDVIFMNMERKRIDPNKDGAMDDSLYDFYRLVEHIRRHSEQYADHLQDTSQNIKAICSDLLIVRNDLAHTRYIACDQTEAFTRHRTLDFTAKCFDRGLEIAKLINRKHNETSIEPWKNLTQLRASFIEFTLFTDRQKKIFLHEKEHNVMEAIAKQALQDLQKMIDQGSSDAIEFVCRVLAPRIGTVRVQSTEIHSESTPN